MFERQEGFLHRAWASFIIFDYHILDTLSSEKGNALLMQSPCNRNRNWNQECQNRASLAISSDHVVLKAILMFLSHFRDETIQNLDW